MSNEEQAFVTYVVELMQSTGPANAKRMFGGYGIFLDGVMFALVADNVLYLKADKEIENEYKDRDLEAFTYNKNGKEIRMSYFQAPEEALENIEVMNAWANKAYGAALRAASKKKQ